jgi:hypothetical protein
MTNLIPWLLFALSIISMATLIGILLWYTGLTESHRYEHSCDCSEHDL